MSSPRDFLLVEEVMSVLELPVAKILRVAKWHTDAHRAPPNSSTLRDIGSLPSSPRCQTRASLAGLDMSIPNVKGSHLVYWVTYTMVGFSRRTTDFTMNLKLDPYLITTTPRPAGQIRMTVTQSSLEGTTGYLLMSSALASTRKECTASS